jgi:hypothetical protein
MKTKRIKALKAWRNSNTAYFNPTPETRASGLAQCIILPADAESYEQILNQFQRAFNRAPVGKEIEYGFRAIGITALKKGRK